MDIKKLSARFPSSCIVCHAGIDEGAPIYWAPGVGAWHEDHGQDAQATPKPKPAAPKGEFIGDAEALFSVFDRAQKHLKYPKIRVAFEGVTDSRVDFKLAGPNSQWAGDVNISAGPFGQGQFFGRLGRDGTFTPGRGSTPEVEQLIAEMANDPTATAARYGRLHGHCCFCTLPLKDERSTSVGYGKICAGHWGLPWGDVDPNLGTGE